MHYVLSCSMFRSERRNAESNTGVRESKKWDPFIVNHFSGIPHFWIWLPECNFSQGPPTFFRFEGL